MAELAAGVYEKLVTHELRGRLQAVDDDLVHREGLADEEVLVRHLAELTRRALSLVGESDGKDPLTRQVAAANRIALAIAREVADSVTDGDLVTGEAEMLLEIASGRLPDGSVPRIQRPDIPLSTGALLVNGRDQPQIGREVIKELASADKVDLLCAFVKWHGLRLIEEALKSFLERGGTLRVITTTYMGATEKRAVDRLVELGARVGVSYDNQRTRLHAKAWLFHRRSELDTAYVGSSNLSRAAMLDGVEWNVRIARAEQPHLIDTFAATFEDYWNDPSFEPYDPERDGQRLDEALRASDARPSHLQIANIDVHPYPYQQEILDELQAVREVHGHWRNLVVMATGTGKTIVAALDYQRLRKQGKVQSLLFVAHTKDILTQSLHTFRAVLKDGSFGELFVDGERPQEWRHVFASIQSLRGLADLKAEQFDMIIVDEFHHAAADSYRKLLDHVEPVVLLGLTATPERTDGEDITHWFDGRKPDVELRLWEALERGLLVPFHYFGIHDDIDLSSVSWRRGAGYDLNELTNLYTGLDSRVSLVVQALRDKLGDVGSMKAVGFCVSIKHAEFMANKFMLRGIPAKAITSAMTTQQREEVLERLRAGDVKVVFTVDLFNEGVDVPEIDTVLFLRPTESATVFLQQLGRGLRLTTDKPVLTVLDFVGHQHKEFRFDKRFTAMTGIRRGNLEDEVDKGFPTLPAGCAIDLDREVGKAVLASIKQALGFRRSEILSELRIMGDPSLAGFLAETGLELEDLYQGARGGWARLRREAGLDLRPVTDETDDQTLGRAIGRMLHVDDPERLHFLREVLADPAPPQWTTADARRQRLLAMLHSALDSRQSLSALEENLSRLWRIPARREELISIIDVLYDRIRRVTPVVPEISHLPLHLHARYSKDELLAAFGIERPRSWVQGIRWVEEEQADLFMVTINKSGKGFKPTTMYKDQAITPTLFQWETQSDTRESSRDGQRYVHHVARGSNVHLFLRETKTDAPPYLYAGPMTYVRHEGERPMRILWELSHPLPGDVFHYAKATTG
jgi:superfamily II DNA or RNA helicase